MAQLADSVGTLPELELFATELVAQYTRLFASVYRPEVAQQARVRMSLQWRQYGGLVGLSDEDLSALIRLVNESISEEGLVESMAEFYSVDGNTVRRIGGRGLQQRHSGGHSEYSVQIWLCGDVSSEDEIEIHQAIEDLLNFDFEMSERMIGFDDPVRGSFYKLFRFVGRISKWSVQCLQNLSVAFESAAARYQVDAVSKLSKVLKQHDNAVLRIDSMIAIKVTINGQAYTLVKKMDPTTEAVLDEEPDRIKDLMALYESLGGGEKDAIGSKRDQETELPLKRVDKKSKRKRSDDQES